MRSYAGAQVYTAARRMGSSLRCTKKMPRRRSGTGPSLVGGMDRPREVTTQVLCNPQHCR
jgi:hypothetical protein